MSKTSQVALTVEGIVADLKARIRIYEQVWGWSVKDMSLSRGMTETLDSDVAAAFGAYCQLVNLLAAYTGE